MHIALEDCSKACSIEKFTGVIHIGSSGEKYAQTYERSNIRNVLWIEPKQENMARLYAGTRLFTISSKYFCINLSNADTTNSITFNQFVRKNIVNINMDEYNLIVFDLNNGTEKEILEGFSPILEKFSVKAVYTNIVFEADNNKCGIEDFDSFMFSIGFERRLTTDNGDNNGEALYINRV